MSDYERSGVSYVTDAARMVSGAVKTGKAISAAAKGAAIGGPYGVVAGAMLGLSGHSGKILAALGAVLLLPVLYILMLPSLVFGGLTSSTGSSGAILLNDSSVTLGISPQLVSSIEQILADGISDVEARIARDFAGTGGDNYEIKNPYGRNLVYSANSFLGQYCAAKNQSWSSISQADMERVLRQGITHFYSYSRTSETREVEDDNPNTPNVVEKKTETWYIYTITYNGEAYFADNIFHLTDRQKELADDYAENLSLFLHDGTYQNASSRASNTIPSLGDVRFHDGATEVVYFNQKDERYADKPYGTDNVGDYGCGPSSMAIVVSSLTPDTVDPAEMAKWSYENGGWCKGRGSYHALIPAAAKAWGLPVEGCTPSEPQRILDALSSGKLVVAIMSKGHFTSSGHFIVLRGVKDGKILVADPASRNRSNKEWDLSIILNEASRGAGAGGPFWIIG